MHLSLEELGMSYYLAIDEKASTFLTCPVCGKNNIVAGQQPFNAHLRWGHKELDQDARLAIRKRMFGTFAEREPRRKHLYKA